ncbi:hypothetical protein FB468_0015 [Leucobacter komagatae]|uniref:Uncharacterized protein n=1 Tax=Leucobacter komagatae TaxID=55969 RepID=A0A542Y1T3_9MICO|nr:hypothetical protein [Leucobacter komagatae]TQL42035.1 hypothetical protein FB468_0015 [Leucobacter komagatae]
MVQFSPEAADGLVKAAERAASTLRVQGWSRSQLASHACEGFSGRHARPSTELCTVEAAIPGVGTVVGGLIGGFAGTTAGQWLGDQIKDVAGKATQGVADAATKIGAGIAVGPQSAGIFFGGLFGT